MSKYISFFNSNYNSIIPEVNLSVGYSLKSYENTMAYRRYNSININTLTEILKSLYNTNKLIKLTNCGLSSLLLLCLNNQGTKWLATYDIYDENKYILDNLIKNVEYVDFSNISPTSFEGYDFVYLEPITRPLFTKYNIQNICNLAHDYNVKVVVDNTLLSIYNYNPLEDGADIIIESGTKWLCGSGDATLGIIIGDDNNEKMYYKWGLAPSPLDCYLVQKGISTLPVRLDKIQTSFPFILEYIKSITPFYNYESRVGMINFHIGDYKFNSEVINNLQYYLYTPTFGIYNSIIKNRNCLEMPWVPTPYNNSLELYTGLEDPEDLIQDLKQAYEKALASGIGKPLKLQEDNNECN